MRPHRAFFNLALMLFGATLTFNPAWANPAAPAPMNEAVDQAGRLRMMSQQIAKLYVLTGSGAVKSAPNQLKEGIAAFDHQLESVAKHSASPEEKASVERIANTWGLVKAAAAVVPDKAQAIAFNQRAEELLTEADNLTRLIEKRAGIQTSRLVNVSGKQRMLSQRIGKLYVLLAWGVDDEGYKDSYQAAVSEFSMALTELETSPQNTPEIKEALARVAKDWNAFKLSELMQSGQYVPALVIRSTDSITAQMSAITELYAANTN